MVREPYSVAGLRELLSPLILAGLLGLSGTALAADELQDLRSLIADLRLEGTVQAGQQAFATNATTGIIVSTHFAPGDIVESGQLLFQLTSGGPQAQVDASEAMVKRRRIELDLARRNNDRVARLFERGTTTETAAQDAEDRLGLAEVALAEAEANFRLNMTGLWATQIVAPISGRVSAPHFDVGSYLDLESGQTLAEIIQFDPILVRYNLPYDLLLEMHQVSPVQLDDLLDNWAITVTLSSGEVLPNPGRVRYFDNSLDDNGKLTVWAELPNPDSILLPGLKVELSMGIDD